MIKYRPFEMHSHTIHSDGDFTLDELCKNARKYQLDGIALTDHNTTAGLFGLPENPAIHGVFVIPGIEWTTFFGHMLVLCADKFIDWRSALPDTIDDYIAEIRNVNGIVGIAHPFSIGSPICTGCHWNYNVKKWESVNYIEILSKPFPTTQFDNPLAFAWWTDLLNQGHRIAVTAGRDWHREPEKMVHAAATYIGLQNGIFSIENIREAFLSGRTYVTTGPAFEVSISNDKGSFSLGDTILPGSWKIQVEIDRTARRNVWDEFSIIPEILIITSNGKQLQVVNCLNKNSIEVPVLLDEGWVRIEMYGKALGAEGKQLGVCSPIYVQKPTKKLSGAKRIL